MKKTISILLLGAVMLATPAQAQNRKITAEQRAYNQLVDQYATSTLGFYIEERCRQLDDNAFKDFAENQLLLNSFMLVLMGEEDNTKLLVGLRETATDAETNPCNADTFKFSLATYQVSSTMATRVRLLGEEEMAKLSALAQANRANRQAAASSAGEQTPPSGQAAAGAQQAQPQNQAVVQPEPGPEGIEAQDEGALEPVDDFEFVPTTQIDRQPETKKPSRQQTADLPEETPTASGPVGGQGQTETGTLLANYINPYPYVPKAAPPGETEKQMKRRHRQEIIDLRRAHRAERDAFDDNEDIYADPDTVKDAIKERQEAEFDAMRNRHEREKDQF